MTNLGWPSGVTVSQRWGASWVSASSNQSCFSDSGSRSVCKNDNLHREMREKKEFVLSVLLGSFISTKRCVEALPLPLTLWLDKIVQVGQEVALLGHSPYVSRSYGGIKLAARPDSCLSMFLIQPGPKEETQPWHRDSVLSVFAQSQQFWARVHWLRITHHVDLE